MPREPGEPLIEIRLTPEGVELQFRHLFKGNQDDWTHEMAGAWMAGLWEGALAVARLNRDYGIRFREEEGEVVVPRPTVRFNQDYEPVEPHPTLKADASGRVPYTQLPNNEPVDKEPPLPEGEQPFNSAQPVKTRPKMTPEEEAALDRKIMAMLSAAPGRRMDLLAARAGIPGVPENKVHFRLWWLQRQGILRWGHHPAGTGHDARGYYEIPESNPGAVLPAPPSREEKPAIPGGEVPFTGVNPAGTAPRMTEEEKAALDRQIIAHLRRQPGQEQAIPKLKESFPGWSPNRVHFRLWSLKQEGRLIWLRQGYGGGGGYRLAPESAREGETDAPLNGSGSENGNHLSKVLVFTRGKIALMVGGDPQPHTRKAIEAALCLTQLRWPLWQEHDAMEWRLRAIRDPAVDLVFINRFNRRYSRHYAHLARDLGKPVVFLPKGYGVQQVVEQCYQQWVLGLISAEIPLAAAA